MSPEYASEPEVGLALSEEILPAVSASRLARGVAALNARIRDPDAAEQLSALQALLIDIDGGAPPAIEPPPASTGVTEAVAAGLEGWLAAQGVDAHVAVSGKATVGLSQETWLLDVTIDGSPRPLVLRLPTPSSGEAAIRTQYAALCSVAASGVPAPAPVWFAEAGTGNPFGRPFLVMERLAGDAPVGWHQLNPGLRTKLAQEAIDILAQMHSIDVEGTALASVTPPPTLRLAGLAKLLRRREPLPDVITDALQWLEHNPPAAGGAPVIVHGDYRMGNLLVAGERITGVLDWEMASPGNRLLDLVWCFIPVFEPTGVDEPPLIERYSARTGTEIDPFAWQWYRTLAFLRLAFYHLAGVRAFDAGRSDDLRLAALRLQLPFTLARLDRCLARARRG